MAFGDWFYMIKFVYKKGLFRPKPILFYHRPHYHVHVGDALCKLYFFYFLQYFKYNFMIRIVYLDSISWTFTKVFRESLSVQIENGWAYTKKFDL